MKLKKIASLALAGVMAVSMLAGCSTPNKGNDNTDTSTTAVNFTSKMVEALEEKIGENEKVTVTADATLQAELEKVVALYGYGLTETNAETALMKADSKLSNAQFSAAGNGASYKDASTAATVMSVKTATYNETQTVVAAVNSLAGNVMADKIDYNNQTLSNLLNWAKTGKSGNFTATAADGTQTTCHFTYTFEVKVATVEFYNTVTEQTNCVVAYTVTRVPQQVND